MFLLLFCASPKEFTNEKAVFLVSVGLQLCNTFSQNTIICLGKICRSNSSYKVE